MAMDKDTEEVMCASKEGGEEEIMENLKDIDVIILMEVKFDIRVLDKGQCMVGLKAKEDMTLKDKAKNIQGMEMKMMSKEDLTLARQGG